MTFEIKAAEYSSKVSRYLGSRYTEKFWLAIGHSNIQQIYMCVRKEGRRRQYEYLRVRNLKKAQIILMPATSRACKWDGSMRHTWSFGRASVCINPDLKQRTIAELSLSKSTDAFRKTCSSTSKTSWSIVPCIILREGKSLPATKPLRHESNFLSSSRAWRMF